MMKQNQYNRIYSFINVLLFAYPFLLLMKVPLKQKISLEILFWLYLIATVGFLVLLVRSIRQINFLQKSVRLMIVVIILLIVGLDLSTRVFLGEEIAKKSVPESPGYIELKVYENKCTFSYGSIFGITDTNHYDYEVDDEYFWILTNNRLVDLNLKTIHLNGKQLEIRRKVK